MIFLLTALLISEGVIADGDFLTISITSANDFEFQPGDTEPGIAAYLSKYARNLSIQYEFFEQHAKAQQLHDQEKTLRDRAVEMSRGGHTTWWFDPDADGTEEISSEDEMDDTAGSPPARKPDDDLNMGPGDTTYECDTDLGSPQAMDCEKLTWSGLKAPDAIEQLKPNMPNIYTSGTCALGISSRITTSISWAHLLAAFETLNNLCVQNPINEAQGGRAYYGTQMVSSWINGRRDSIAGVNGSQALPVEVNTTVWRHDPAKNASLKCEWQQATNGKSVSKCPGE